MIVLLLQNVRGGQKLLERFLVEQWPVQRVGAQLLQFNESQT